MQRNRGNNRMEKTRDLFRKIGEIKGTFHIRMGTIKDRSGMDQAEAEDINRKCQNTQTNYPKKF